MAIDREATLTPSRRAGSALPLPHRGRGYRASEAGEGDASCPRAAIRRPRPTGGWGGGFGASGLLPLDWASAIGGALARAIGPRLGISKRARLNIGRALPELSQ